jgi:hypothetical protein
VAYQEITEIEIKEELRLWLQNKRGPRSIAETVGVDRKTVRRYIETAQAAGLVREGGEGQLTNALIGAVIEAVRPERPAGHGVAWEPVRPSTTDQGVAGEGSEADQGRGPARRPRRRGSLPHSAPIRGRRARVRWAVHGGARDCPSR